MGRCLRGGSDESDESGGRRAHQGRSGGKDEDQPGTERLADLGHTLALQAETLLSGPGLERIRRCGGPGCGWFFLDRSRSGTRRWCSSGDCGNRDRDRRHYARTRNAQ
ncbi:hypothetical protein AQF52_1001 [Streptomyces venezuelae]|uniref:CGNR zinc finger domain-containing protein n=1 Tax=Streptomyces gardneri TaxID=66892 RepID=UPI000721C713|nr:CGNR zinc finger domain-containing protein [Streptomyces gardneri]ALO06597.1 hypothetical protein AQF52_1001 [Streptomyces venezuelae]QPK44013.1 CGNR zinc finger domain-containing protein [Streptomyces gardneri]WRK35285.1 CGNR zinc finger domain-containing protein [Streptomyces venezuelae]